MPAENLFSRERLGERLEGDVEGAIGGCMYRPSIVKCSERGHLFTFDWIEIPRLQKFKTHSRKDRNFHSYKRGSLTLRPTSPLIKKTLQ